MHAFAVLFSVGKHFASIGWFNTRDTIPFFALHSGKSRRASILQRIYIARVRSSGIPRVEETSSIIQLKLSAAVTRSIRSVKLLQQIPTNFHRAGWMNPCSENLPRHIAVATRGSQDDYGLILPQNTGDDQQSDRNPPFFVNSI